MRSGEVEVENPLRNHDKDVFLPEFEDPEHVTEPNGIFVGKKNNETE
jgi:hypothetical protein